jgi:hypothetical protein
MKTKELEEGKLYLWNRPKFRTQKGIFLFTNDFFAVFQAVNSAEQWWFPISRASEIKPVRKRRN